MLSFPSSDLIERNAGDGLRTHYTHLGKYRTYIPYPVSVGLEDRTRGLHKNFSRIVKIPVLCSISTRNGYVTVT